MKLLRCVICRDNTVLSLVPCFIKLGFPLASIASLAVNMPFFIH